MKEINLLDLVDKAEELKIIPFLEEIISFVKDIKPALDYIYSSVEENISKMPKATKKLTKVTEATEMATNEIMDLVDKYFVKTADISSELEKLSGNENEVHVNRIKEILEEINNDSTSIMMSLQVQDITSQQIAAVNHLLTTIQKKLREILKRYKSYEISDLLHLQESDESQVNVSKLHREIAFDPDAIKAVATDINRQEQVDDMIRKHTKGTLTDSDMIEETDNDEDEKVSSEDIDALFAAQAGIDSESEPEESEKATQEDIDALFSGAAGSDSEKDEN